MSARLCYEFVMNQPISTASTKLAELLVVSLLMAVLLFATAGCTEKVASGQPVSIPPVTVNCQTAQCRTNVTGATIIVSYTTSGCGNFDFGATVSTSNLNLNCTSSGGCAQNVPAIWKNLSDNQVTQIPSGTYTICVRIDYDHSYPGSTTGDTTGELDNVSVMSSTSAQSVTGFTDL